MLVSNVTTIDNPYNPFDDFSKWYTYDVSHGYNTSEKLGRLSELSSSLPPTLQNMYMTEAVDKLVAINPLFYKKITKTVPDAYK